ncbi:ATP-dependent helicase [Caenimonas sedimenti]|uniref:DNA 3'-5' helicase n=1 Tax=Caenimonas sedimenti TaxID=2596921 RepID=A0A562ZSZ6_9BURK|nr:ATP-dependent helicase [Caenimonas sedimenti]TWO71486.1 ATP-dependent helicase [Caenimonas sedimenti]
MASLSPRQREAVAHDGHLLIVAGPGSGKTTTTVAKAARTLKNPARSLVMVTFTKDAAEEMRKRLVAALTRAEVRQPDESRLVVATFHSIAIRHLKRNGMRLKVLSPQQQDMIYRDAAMSADVDRDAWGDVQKEFERVMYAVAPDSVDVAPITQRVVARYRDLLRATGQTDLYTVMRDCAIGAHEGTLPPLPFTDMFVDEGQDTDDLQRLWIFAHARVGVRVTIVGDDDQSVYEWRNALGYEGMRSFLETFNAHRIELGENYRCRSEILTPAANLIQCNQRRLGKTLVAERGRGGTVAAFRTASPQNQAEALAEIIQAAPDKHSNAAILARTNRSLDLVEIMLRGNGVPYARVGRSIWEQPVIAGYVGLLQTLLTGSPPGLLPVLQLRNVSDQVRSDLLHSLRGNVGSFLDGEVPTLNSMDRADAETLGDLAKAFAYWRGQLRGAAGGAAGSVREVILEVGELYARWSRGEHAKNLLDLCSRILSDLKGPLSGRINLVTRKERDHSQARLVLMTMHGAKGLEFETVHIVDANDTDDGSAVVRPEAERRLMYVAMTRAKNCCLVWVSGRPHPSVAEAQLVYKRTRDELVQLVRASA